MNNTNGIYANILDKVLLEGDLMETRNHSTYSYVDGLSVKFDKVPLVTTRKTAWKYALSEMEWFLSGEAECPEKLAKWWKGQLDPDGLYVDGYGHQLRMYTSIDDRDMWKPFDQIEFIINALKDHPNSRRLITTTWHPEEMSRITETNSNPNTPTTCHGTLVQYFVRDSKLKMNVLARSQDLLLGTVHNWIQYWAYLQWLAYKTGYEVGSMTWIFGDAHIYNHPSHVDTAKAIIENCKLYDDIELVYTPTSDWFKASDFSIKGDIPEPFVKSKPELF